MNMKKGARKFLQLGEQVLISSNENTKSGKHSLHDITIRYYY